MALRMNTITVDAADPGALARFWAEALAWVVVDERPDEVLIAPGMDPAALPGAVPILFGESADAKAGKNRLHFDLVPDDRDAEVARLEALGARRVDLGQGEVSWVVMADPEGNEFCVLRSHEG